MAQGWQRIRAWIDHLPLGKFIAPSRLPPLYFCVQPCPAFYMLPTVTWYGLIHCRISTHVLVPGIRVSLRSHLVSFLDALLALFSNLFQPLQIRNFSGFGVECIQ